MRRPLIGTLMSLLLSTAIAALSITPAQAAPGDLI
jgi:hypothetical protein